MKRQLFSLLFILTASCGTPVVVPNISGCATLGALSDCTEPGTYCMVCADTETSNTHRLDFAHYIDFVEAQPERPDPDNAGQTLPAHAPAITTSAEDFNKDQTAFEAACIALGNRCTQEIHARIDARRTLYNVLTKGAKK